jgi:hypothetical protein
MAKNKQRVEAVERQLLRDIQKLTSRQFVYEDGWCGMVPFHRKLTELQTGPPVPFAELTWREQADVLRSFIPWNRYPEAGWLDEYRIRDNIAAGKPSEQWLEGTSLRESFRLLADGKERRQNTELTDFVESAQLPSRAAKATTDIEHTVSGMDAIRRLDAAYTAGGTDALAKMNGIEIQVLYNDKMAALETVRKITAEPGDKEIIQLYKQMLEQQTADMAAWMRVHCPDIREMEQEASRLSLAELKERATERTTQAEHRKSRDKDMER